MRFPQKLSAFIREYYDTDSSIPLHKPQFDDHEKDKVLDTIQSSFVSSVGVYVDEFEKKISNYTGSCQTVATVNGSSALYCALYIAGVKPGDLVITQALTFVATCNAIAQLQASPIFIDVNRTSLGLCPFALEDYLELNAMLDESGTCIHKVTQQVIRAAVPMHTFGHPAQLDELVAVCNRWGLLLIEDAAESLGSFYKGQHTGTFGELAALSFNGNKVITTGGGGAILCRTTCLGARAKHLTTTAKIAHEYEYDHDELGFNFRMPNLNAALGCAQISKLDRYVEIKRELARDYQSFFQRTDYILVKEPEYAKSNYWLNAVICPTKKLRDDLLEVTNSEGVMTRPVWRLMNHLPMYKNSLRGPLPISEWLSDCLVNLPSTPNLRQTV
ncbi:LegC family aminotransferase [Pseudoalteromonas aurantia]|uniref:Aminotransferase DegT n=1 Tax=Pseudoalteromonas aurantia TaxID=43654 RepID=A0A5S3VBR7_9GAMM|nr:LegC family aminotransferase [Pseudoalteromonas aurantia]TMO69482.1 aminotransferase DegT [Pseudoalteromonas aurantia]